MTADGSAPEGKFVVTISTKPPQASVDEQGHVVDPSRRRPPPPARRGGAARTAGCGEPARPRRPAPLLRLPRRSIRRSGGHGATRPSETGLAAECAGSSRSGDFDQPVFVAQPPGEHDDLYVVEKTGRVILVRDGEPWRAAVPRPQPARSAAAASRGCCRSRSRPDYERSGRFYVDYTDTSGDTRIESSSGAPSPTRRCADPATRREVLHVDQPFSNHNGGLLLFGPDGHLYIGLGDGGASRRPDAKRPEPRHAARQDPSHRPAALRRRPRTRSRESNPFVGRPGRAARDLRLRAAQPVALLVRPPQRRAGDRRRRPGPLEEVDLVAAQRLGGRELRLVGVRGHPALQRRPARARTRFPRARVSARRRRLRGHRRLCRPRRGLRSLYGRYLYADFCRRRAAQLPGRARAAGARRPARWAFGCRS